MSWDGLTECRCGHVANHHGAKFGCAVAGCPCRKFEVPPPATMTVREANVGISRTAQMGLDLAAGDETKRAELERRAAWLRRYGA